MHVANRASAISANVGNVSFKQKTWLEHFLPLGSAHHNERSTVYDALKMNMNALQININAQCFLKSM